MSVFLYWSINTALSVSVSQCDNMLLEHISVLGVLLMEPSFRYIVEKDNKTGAGSPLSSL